LIGAWAGSCCRLGEAVQVQSPGSLTKNERDRRSRDARRQGFDPDKAGGKQTIHDLGREPWMPAAADDAIDAGHVRAVRGHQGRTFEVMAAQVSNDDGKPVLFSGVPGDADRQRTQLNGVLIGLGMTADTEVTILSDGADGPRSLGEAASTGTVYHVLDWFHLAMRIQHAAQCAGGWPANTVSDCRNRAKFTDAVEHIRWRLWHGQTRRALCLIQRTLAALKTQVAGQTAAARSAAKLAKALVALETYVSGLADLIIDYASARLDDEPFSTSPTEGAVQWLLHRRMGARQQMRWSPRGAHLMLQVRTAIVNGTFSRRSVNAQSHRRMTFQHSL
jgi:hypothetical protein